MRKSASDIEPGARPRNPDQPPPFTKHQPRVLKANRSSRDGLVAGATQHAPRQIAVPPPQPQVPSPVPKMTQPPEPPANFEVLRTHLKLDERRTKNPPAGVISAPQTRARLSPAIVRQAVLSFLLTASIGTGYLLYQQGVAIQKIASNPAASEAASGPDIYSDSISTRRAAPERAEQGRESAPRIQVDMSEPGMRYEYLDRGAIARPPRSEQ